MPALHQWVATLAVAALAGCCSCPPPPQSPRAYFGPTESIAVVVARVNDNAARVPTLWSQLDYTANFIDPATHKATAASGDGTLLYRRPGSLLLSCYKDIAGEVFQLGTDGDQFWVKARTTVDSSDYYWGHVANLGRPGCLAVPVRPDGVAQVLGVGLFQPDLLAEPAPVMRFDNDADAYVFDFNVRRPGRWVTQKEVWYDRRSALPRRVVLYGDDGRAVLRAELSNPQPIDLPDVPPARRPVVARHYDLRFPDTGSTLSLDLSDPALSHKVNARVTIPNDHSFDREDNPPDDNDKVIQVDAGVGAGTVG